MQTIGLIGGMSWESTVSYYQIINEAVKRELGGLHSARILLYSVDFAEIEDCQARGDWEKSAEILAGIAVKLEKAGASFIVICTNTMHKVADRIEKNVSIPLLHIAKETARELLSKNIKKVGLLGTKYTMGQAFYKSKIHEAGIEVLIPDEDGMETVNGIIYEELCLGIISEASRKKYISIIEDLKRKGAEGIILGCTEIGLLVHPEDLAIPVFDTTRIHAESAARLALKAPGQ